jgi:microcystin-dependent protein
MTLYKWSQTASADATADSTINWSEGQAPSSVNDSARAMMAATAKYRDDIAGAILTGGTSTAYTVSSYQSFDTLAHLDKQMIGFTPHVINGVGPVTLSVDGLGAKPLRLAQSGLAGFPNVELPASMLIIGTPYTATYSNTDGAFYLHGFLNNPYNIPIGGGMDFWGSSAPNSSFAFPIGQAISRTMYSALFSLVGTTYGVGDGSTTFNLPDKTGRVSAMLEASATRLTSAFFGGNSTNLGATGGSESHRLTASELPAITSSNTQTITVGLGSGNIPTTSGSWNNASTVNTSGVGGNFGQATAGVGNVSNLSGSNSISVTSNNTGNNAHVTVQPTIICNYIMRVI